MRAISYRIGYQSETKIISVEVHPQLSNNGHPVDGTLVGAGSPWAPNIHPSWCTGGCWFTLATNN